MVEKYAALLHALQTGVAYKMQYDPNGGTSPKHLRVGVDVAMCDHGALVQLLIEKGLFTLEEYEGHLVTKLADEVASYEAWLSARTGGNIKLG